MVDSDPGIDLDVLAALPSLNPASTTAVAGRPGWGNYISNLKRIQEVVIRPDLFGSSLQNHQLKAP